MKTLDEVIDKLIECHTRWCRWSETSDIVERDAVEEAIRYLRELRDMTDIPMEYFENGGTLQKLRNTSQFTCPKCHSEFVILDDPDGDHQQLEKCRALLQDFYRNDPLSWDELKGMEGKPVWVEQHHGDTKGWLLILRKCDDVVTCTTKHGNSFYLYKANYGEKWQAYRKERE